MIVRREFHPSGVEAAKHMLIIDHWFEGQPWPRYRTCVKKAVWNALTPSAQHRILWWMREKCIEALVPCAAGVAG